MGVHPNINFGNFPQQGPNLGRRAKVYFHYTTSQEILGTIVRDDIQDPGRSIIHLDDGRLVLTTECQFELLPETTYKVICLKDMVGEEFKVLASGLSKDEAVTLSLTSIEQTWIMEE